jgi:hypothetical protein
MKAHRSAILGFALAILGAAACEDQTEVVVPPPPDPPLEITVTPNSAQIEVGKNTQFVASVTGGAAGGDKTVTWTSSAPTVASVAANGNVVTVTGVAPGTATIRAVATADASVIGAANVTVVDPGGVPPTISIESITTGATNVPVNVNNVFGQVEVNINLDIPVGTVVSSVQVLANNVVIYEQSFTSPELGLGNADEAQSAVPITASWDTREFDRTLPATVGTVQGKYRNGTTTVTAQVIGPQGTITASTSRQIVLNNTAFVYVRRTQPSGTNCTLSSATSVGFPAVPAGSQWCTGDVVFDAVGVSFSGNPNDDVASLTLTGNANTSRNVQDAAAPFQMTLQKSGGAAASRIDTWEFANVQFLVTGVTVGGQPLSGCIVTDASPTPINLNCGVLGGNVQPAIPLNADNVAPAITLFDLTPATLACVNPGGCYVSGNPATPAFVFGVRAGFFAHVDQGVGSPTATFMAGPPGALIPVTTGQDLAETVTSTELIANATSCDKLNNCVTRFAGPVAAAPLTSATGAQPFGVDSTDPTQTIAGLAANSFFNAATLPAAVAPAWTIGFTDGGVGPSGFAADPVRVQLKKTRPAGSTCYIPQNPIDVTAPGQVACLTSSGAVNYRPDDGLIDIADVGGAFAIPNNAEEGYWEINGFVRDQALNFSKPDFFRITLLDGTPPVAGGISCPSSMPGGANVTCSAGLGDNIDLGRLLPFLSYGGFNFQFPAVTLGTYGAADGLVSTATGNFTAVAFMRAIEATLGTGRAGGAVTEAQTLTFDITDIAGNLASTNVNINAAVQFAAGGAVPSLTVAPTDVIFAPANVLHGNFLHLAPSNATVCSDAASAACTSPRSTVLSSTMTGPNATFANPFVRVEYYYQDPVNARWYLIGTGTPAASDNTVTSTRTWTYTFTWTVSGLLDSSGAQLLGALPVVAVGVHSSGSALISTGTAQAVTLVSD